MARDVLVQLKNNLVYSSQREDSALTYITLISLLLSD